MLAGAVFWVTISATASIEVVTVALGFVPLLFAGVESGAIEVLLAVLRMEVRVGGCQADRPGECLTGDCHGSFGDNACRWLVNAAVRCRDSG